MSGSRPVPSSRANPRGSTAALAGQATNAAAPTSRLAPRVAPGSAYGTRPAQGRPAPVPPASRADQQNRLDPRSFAGRLKRVVVAGSVVGFGVFFALVAEHVVGVTSVRGGTTAGGGTGASAGSQASSPYDGFFGPSSGQSQSGGLIPGGIVGGGNTGGSGGVTAGSGLVNGGGGAPVMITSGS